MYPCVTPNPVPSKVPKSTFDINYIRIIRHKESNFFFCVFKTTVFLALKSCVLIFSFEGLWYLWLVQNKQTLKDETSLSFS